jgi:hypothetical protein
MDLGRGRNFGKHPLRQVLQADGQRPQAARGRDRQVGETGGRDRENFAARERGVVRRRNRHLEDLDRDIRDHIELDTQDNIERGIRRRTRVRRWVAR